MSEAKTIFGLFFLFGLLLLLLGSIALGTCADNLSKWEKTSPSNIFEIGQFILDVVGTLFSDCSGGMGFIMILVMIPIGLALAYLVVKALPFT